VSGDPEPATVRALELDVLEHLRAQLHDCKEITGPDGSIWFIPRAPLATTQGATAHTTPYTSATTEVTMGAVVGLRGFFQKGAEYDQSRTSTEPTRRRGRRIHE
jgi:hypothetical protein